jgi:RsiW-degrading membrane proteinase PrsW (M82 family)
VNLSGPLLVGMGFVQAMVYLGIILAIVRLAIGRFEREPLLYVVGAFLSGFAAAAAILLIYDILGLPFDARTQGDTGERFGIIIVFAGVEEFSKGVALVLTFFIGYLIARRGDGRIEFAGVMDGVVYGSAVGLGFALYEDTAVYLHYYGHDTFVLRRILASLPHPFFASLTGIGIVVFLREGVHHRFLKVILPLLCFSGAVLLHAAYNFTLANSVTLIKVGSLTYVLLADVTLLPYVVEGFVLMLYMLLVSVGVFIQRRMIRTSRTRRMEGLSDAN